jgi:hypothetical protein
LRIGSKETIMSHLEWLGLLLGLALSVDLIGAVYRVYRDRQARRLAIKRGRTLTAKFALPPRRPEAIR